MRKGESTASLHMG